MPSLYLLHPPLGMKSKGNREGEKAVPKGKVNRTGMLESGRWFEAETGQSLKRLWAAFGGKAPTAVA